MTTNELKADAILDKMGIEKDSYPADAFFEYAGEELIGSYSHDRKLVVILMEDNPEMGETISKEMIGNIAYTVNTLVTDFGCAVHSWTMKHVSPYRNLTIVKTSNLDN